MKIVINALSARIGGGQTYLKNLLANLPNSPDLDILVYMPISLRLPDDHRIRYRPVRWCSEYKLLRICWEYFSLPRILAKEKANVLFCPGGIISTRVPSGCKTVTMFRNMIPFDPVAMARLPFGVQRFRNLLLKPAMLHSMANADLTIFISNHARRIIESLTHVINPVTIPHGISSAFRTHGVSTPRPSWLPSGEYILYVSRFDVYKHHYEVATAYAALPEDLRARYKLLFVGELNEVLTGRVKDLIRGKNLEKQILVVGPIPYTELPAIYHHATVNLFASSCENCPNILLEALGAGRAILASSIMPMPEFGEDAAAYFSPTDPMSIYEQLMGVLLNKKRRSELAIAAVRRSADFDWAATSSTTWQCITNLIREERRESE